MKFSMSVSQDGRYCKIQIDEPPTANEALTAQDLEGLISHFAAIRQKMSPRVGLPSPLEQGDDVQIDAKSPHLDHALLEPSPDLIVLSIAFPGLGWRSVSLTSAECEALGRHLLAAAARSSASGHY